MNRQRDAGFVLATLIFFLTALTVLIAVTVPIYQMQAKRMQEEELIFRGGEYIRAIQKFQKKFGAWPPSIDALVETNGLRFLRKRYTDPITGKPFRILTINPDGTVNGSLVFKANNPFQPNNPFNSSPFGSPNGTQPGQTPQPGQTQSPTGFPPAGQTQSTSQPFGQSGTSQTGYQPAPPMSQTPTSSQPQQQTGTAGQQSTSSSFNTAPNQLGSTNGTPTGLGIIGVASDSDKTSVMVYNNYQKYNQWEFVAVLNNRQNPNGTPAMGTGGSTPFGTTPSPSSTSPFGQQSSPFGQQPNTSQPNSPFGFGTTPPPPPPPPRNPGGS